MPYDRHVCMYDHYWYNLIDAFKLKFTDLYFRDDFIASLICNTEIFCVQKSLLFPSELPIMILNCLCELLWYMKFPEAPRCLMIDMYVCMTITGAI